tara:strand:+ start:419 stop:640 length:222 start_codon:yes stop_codon:yes gene_type:complete
MLDPNNIDDLKSLEKCRSITKEILRYGVNNLEIIKIIDLLSLELEDTNIMKKVQYVLKNDINLEKEEKPKFEI